jgi:hypothetical protein
MRRRGGSAEEDLYLQEIRKPLAGKWNAPGRTGKT